MNKKIVLAFCLGILFTSAGLMAQSAESAVAVAAVATQDNGKTIAADQLPEAVKTALAGDNYKGWTVKEAREVSTNNEAGAAVTHYEVVLTKENETRTVKMSADGTELK